MAVLTGPLGALTAAIDAVCEEDPARVCDREAIKALHRQLARLEAATTRATAAFDAGRDWEDKRPLQRYVAVDTTGSEPLFAYLKTTHQNLGPAR